MGEFTQWLIAQTEDAQDDIAVGLERLKEVGPLLGRPGADTLSNSKIGNLKELRIQYKGKPIRILYAFDPSRRGIILLGGIKKDDKRWYKQNIPIAEKRYLRFLETDQ